MEEVVRCAQIVWYTRTTTKKHIKQQHLDSTQITAHKKNMQKQQHPDNTRLTKIIQKQQHINTKQHKNCLPTESNSAAVRDVQQSSHPAPNGDKEDDNVPEGPPQPKRDGLVTLSCLPAAHWKNLFHLKLVKERNKPTEAPKKPPNAPFFLQWRGGTRFPNRVRHGEHEKCRERWGRRRRVGSGVVGRRRGRRGRERPERKAGSVRYQYQTKA